MGRKKVADIVVETLRAAGVKHCWGVPGDTLNHVTDAIRRSDIEFVHVRHEEAAGFAAGAVGAAIVSSLCKDYGFWIVQQSLRQQ